MLNPKIYALIQARMEEILSWQRAFEAGLSDAKTRYSIHDREIPHWWDWLSRLMKRREDTFSERLLKLIAQKEVKDSDLYKKAQVSRQSFSKLRSHKAYQPSKRTALLLALALELSLSETEALLRTAGYALSYSLKSDIIIRCCLENQIYDVLIVDEALEAFGEPLLSGKCP